MKKISLLLFAWIFAIGCSGCSSVNLNVVPSGTNEFLAPFNTTVMVSINVAGGKGKLIGSAFAIDKNRLVTAGHVCVTAYTYQATGELEKNIQITSTNDKGEFTTQNNAQIVKVSEDYDLCILKLKNHGIKPVKMMADEEYQSLKIGDSVVIIGAPNGVFATITEGRITSFTSAQVFPGYWRKGQLTMSAPCFGGNSGGPVFHNGKLVGVLVMGLSDYDHVSFATDVITLHKFLSSK